MQLCPIFSARRGAAGAAGAGRPQAATDVFYRLTASAGHRS